MQEEVLRELLNTSNQAQGATSVLRSPILSKSKKVGCGEAEIKRVNNLLLQNKQQGWDKAVSYDKNPEFYQ